MRAAILTALLLASSAQAAPITYIVHREIGPARIDGFFLSDGTLGKWFDTTVVLDLSLDMFDGTQTTHYGLPESWPRAVPLYGLSATATDLIFNATFNDSAFSLGPWGMSSALCPVDPRICHERFTVGFTVYDAERSNHFVIASVPEPGSAVLLGLGLLVLVRRRRCKASS